MASEESRTTITILTDSYRIKGFIDLLPGSRITDYLVESKDFIAVTNAEVWDHDRKVLSAPFINVALSHIQVVMPGS
jgi:hypothetical protein